MVSRTRRGPVGLLGTGFVRELDHGNKREDVERGLDERCRRSRQVLWVRRGSKRALCCRMPSQARPLTLQRRPTLTTILAPLLSEPQEDAGIDEEHPSVSPETLSQHLVGVCGPASRR